MPDISLPVPVFLAGEKGSSLALYRFAVPSSPHLPVILTHGTFSNAGICSRLAAFLRDAGFDCWIYEWSGHGRSRYGDFRPDAEDHGRYEVPRVLDHVKAKTGQRSVFWVAHSGGGFMPLIYLARHPDRQADIRALVALGSQTMGAGKTLLGKLRILAVTGVIQITGRVPGPALGLGPEDETMGFMPQWCRWNWTGKWTGRDGFDYGAAMDRLEMPALFFAGNRDLIAPPAGCRMLVAALGSSKKDIRVCGRSTGYSEDFTHARLIASQAARRDIWPLIREFLEKTGVPAVPGNGCGKAAAGNPRLPETV